jgi:hypothetical protein
MTKGYFFAGHVAILYYQENNGAGVIESGSCSYRRPARWFLGTQMLAMLTMLAMIRELARDVYNFSAQFGGW